MDTASTVFPQKIHWETDGTSRIPFMAYTEADQHRKELERLFYRKHWCYVGLEAEIKAAILSSSRRLAELKLRLD